MTELTLEERWRAWGMVVLLPPFTVRPPLSNYTIVLSRSIS